MRTKQEVEENDRMGKTRDLFNKIGDIKETFHSRMGTTKDKNDEELTKQKRL